MIGQRRGRLLVAIMCAIAFTLTLPAPAPGTRAECDHTRLSNPYCPTGCDYYQDVCCLEGQGCALYDMPSVGGECFVDGRRGTIWYGQRVLWYNCYRATTPAGADCTYNGRTYAYVVEGEWCQCCVVSEPTET